MPTCHPTTLLLDALSTSHLLPLLFTPHIISISICIFFSLLTFVVSTVTNNVSQVDKLWSITPFLYTWTTVCDRRTCLMACLATLWGFRLTFNFWRRGGYAWPLWRGEEDYRWAFLRDGILHPALKHPIPWTIFNLTFISCYQNFLLLLLAGPSFVAWSAAADCDTPSPLSIFDCAGVVLFLFFLVIETMADNQQWAFQSEKQKQRRRQQNTSLASKQQRKEISPTMTKDDEYDDGFCQSGLFAIVRKPNYAAEQGLWISYYLFAIGATGGRHVMNWSCLGWVLLVLLFQGSGWLTEKISCQKYPRYQEYMARVPRYIPSLTLKKQNVKNK